MADALSVITLQQAKDFLVVDYPDKDADITRHIKSAVAMVERYTNHLLYARPVNYDLYGCSLEIYDYPISFPSNALKHRQNVLSVTYFGKAGDSLSANVGYSSVDDVPSDLIDACYKIITYLFENRDIYSAGLPLDVQLLMNRYRRSATF